MLAGRWPWVEVGILEGAGGKGRRCGGSTAGRHKVKLGSTGGKAAWRAARCSWHELLPWPDLGVPAAHPWPEEGSHHGLCQALRRRDAACPSLPLALFFFFPSLGKDKARNLLRPPGRVVLSRTIPLVRHQIPACEPSASLTKTPREKLLDWKKDINLKSIQQSNCRVFPPRARASQGKLITMTHRSPDLIFHFKICK